MEWFKSLEPLTQTFLASLFTWGMTALGATSVFLFKEMNRRVLDGMLGFAIMMALDVGLG
jgi:ZIP family zinc transporter|tara:strand:+ start:324 stop:503 length:180 start_codon:yes stop_codon:yes gene_type:complete